jgi:hypothetical protein
LLPEIIASKLEVIYTREKARFYKRRAAEYESLEAVIEFSDRI